MRKVLMLMLVIVLTMGFTSVFAQDDMSGVDPSGATVVYWHQYNSGSQLETIDALIAEFNETNEWGITVEGIAQGNYNDLRERMNAAIISGELPNLVAGFGNDAISYYIDDAAADLRPFVEDETWGFSEDELANLNQGILETWSFEAAMGGMLGWPNQISANVLSVNLTMLQDLGFDGPPTNFEDFKAIACASAEAEDTQGYPIKPDSSNFESILAGFGGTMFHDGAYDFTSPEAIAVLEMYQDIYESGCAYIPDSRFGNTDDFAIGLNPMALGSSAGIPFIESGMADAGYETEWTVTTTPWTEGNRAIQVFSPGITMVPSAPEQEVASWLFIKFLASADSQALWTQNTGYFPLNDAAIASLGDMETENPFFATVLALINDPDVNIYSSPQQLSYGAIRGLVSEAVSNVTANGRDVMEVAEELEAEANATHEDLQ